MQAQLAHEVGDSGGGGNGNGNGNWGAAVAGGAILGLALGAVIASQPPPPPRYYAPPPPQPYYPAQPVYAQPVYPTLNQAHVDWCAATYPNYQPATDTYLVSGMEEVWLKKTKSADFLKKLDETFKQERDAGKAPAVPPRA